MTSSKVKISSVFCQSMEQQKMGKLQLPSTTMTLMIGQLPTMKVIMPTHITSFYFMRRQRARMIMCGSVSLKSYIGTLLFLQASFARNLIIPTTKSFHNHFKLDNFEKVQFLHYKNFGVTLREQLGQIVGNHFEALMLKSPMLIQAYIPNRVANQSGDTIQLLMEFLKIKNDQILISKTISANETILKLYQHS
jgi:hypothetical protein